jgi:glucose-1-phosphate thymidylyltransferase
MKAVILAGGHATRLWPITKNRAKPLLPLGEKPIIDYIVEDLKDLDEIIVSTNEKFADDFREYAENFGRDNLRVVVEDQDSEEEKPGTIGAIIKLLDQEDLDDDILIVGGDNYFSFDLRDLIDFVRDKGPTNVVYDVEDSEIASSFGIVDTEEDRIVGFEEKPDEPPSTLASTACYYFPEEQVELFREYEQHFQETDVPKEKYLDEPGRLIEWAHGRTDMFAYRFDGEWFDIGTRKGYIEALRSVLKERIVDGDIENSKIGDDVVIMEGAEIVDSEISSSIVFPETRIEDSDVRNSVVDRHCNIKDTDLNEALIGEHTTL